MHITTVWTLHLFQSKEEESCYDIKAGVIHLESLLAKVVTAGIVDS